METRDPLLFLQMEITRLRDENRSLKEELSVLRSSVRALSALQDIIQRLTPEMDVIQLVDDLLASVLAVVDAEDGSLLLLDEEKGELVFAVVRGRARQRLTGYRMPKDQGIAGWVVANKKAQIVSDVRADPRFFAGVDQSFDFHTRSLACAPLLDGERVLGVVEALNKADEREFTEVDHDLLVVVAQLAAVAIIRAEAFAEQSSPA